MAHYYDHWKDEVQLLRERAERAEEEARRLRERVKELEAALKQRARG